MKSQEALKRVNEIQANWSGDSEKGHFKGCEMTHPECAVKILADIARDALGEPTPKRSEHSESDSKVKVKPRTHLSE
jgi:hypothetical protein